MTDTETQNASKPGARQAPSETALATASLRALAAYDPHEEVRCADTLAEIFLTEEQKAPLRNFELREWVMKNKVAPGAYEFMIARTAFFDEIFRDALIEKTPQVVLLGAGYDTRPYRYVQLLGDAMVYELDTRPMQQKKQEKLECASVPIPPGVRFVPIDFAADDLEQTLLGAGFEKDRVALFLWEGVSYYLTREAVDRMLAGVRSLSVEGSCLAFDFASLSPEALGESGVRKLREQMSTNHPNEPTRFGIPQGMLEPFLLKRGFQVKELVGPDQMQARYLTLRDGSALGRVPALFNLVVVQVS